MFYLIKNGKIGDSANAKISQDGYKTIEKDFTEAELKKLENGCLLEDDGTITETAEYNGYILQRDKDIIEQEFQNSFNQITTGYSQSEINFFETELEEAKKVINLETSEILEAMITDGETVDELANLIVQKATAFKLAVAGAKKIKRQKLKDLETN